jgi:hypothetical protein
MDVKRKRTSILFLILVVIHLPSYFWASNTEGAYKNLRPEFKGEFILAVNCITKNSPNTQVSVYLTSDVGPIYLKNYYDGLCDLNLEEMKTKASFYSYLGYPIALEINGNADPFAKRNMVRVNTLIFIFFTMPVFLVWITLFNLYKSWDRGYRGFDLISKFLYNPNLSHK